jgi:hypothetical protein
MRIRRYAPALLALPMILGGCGGAGTPAASASSTPTAAPWLVLASGSATPSPGPSWSGTPKPALPSVSFLPTSSACATTWPQDTDQVLIPMVVTPLAGALKVEWPAMYGPDYRVAAVDQVLVTGAQPEPRWVNVSAGSGCTATATLTGLKSGNPYIVWLDAPDTPHRLDGSRSLYSGRSAVVKPR